MLKQRRFKQVDVFTTTPYLGNPLAVVLDGEGLSTEQMQHFAQWTNLSETTFVLSPTQTGADYRVRIFTPGSELPFAGHPTLGTCHAWLEAGGKPKIKDRVVQECAVGKIQIQNVNAAQRAFAAPPLSRSAPAPNLLAQVCAALGVHAGQVIAAQTLHNGPEWLAVLLDSPQTVLALRPDHEKLKNLNIKVGVSGIYNVQTATKTIASLVPPEIEVRAFAASIGIEEDPVTGSLNASLAQWLIADGYMPKHYLAAQGTVLGRAGRVHIVQDDLAQVWVGGAAVTCIDGSVML